MDPEPGRIGFMSTQRQENRWQRTSCTEHGVPSRRFVPDGVQSARASGQACPAPFARQDRAHARVGTAPPQAIVWLPAAWLATNSLQSDHCTTPPVRLVLQAIRRSSPPFGAGRRAVTGTPATRRSSLPPIPLPSGPPRLHPALPHGGSPIEVPRNQRS